MDSIPNINKGRRVVQHQGFFESLPVYRAKVSGCFKANLAFGPTTSPNISLVPTMEESSPV